MKDTDTFKEATLSSSCLGKNRYKAWALAIILFLAFWSMLLGSVGLATKWYTFGAENSDKSPDLDALEMELREKLVRHTWDRYRYNSRAKLNSFWYEAFEAAYEDLENENPVIKEEAIKEIAKLSAYAFEIDLTTGNPKEDLIKLYPYQESFQKRASRSWEY